MSTTTIARDKSGEGGVGSPIGCDPVIALLQEALRVNGEDECLVGYASILRKKLGIFNLQDLEEAVMPPDEGGKPLVGMDELKAEGFPLMHAKRLLAYGLKSTTPLTSPCTSNHNSPKVVNGGGGSRFFRERPQVGEIYRDLYIINGDRVPGSESRSEEKGGPLLNVSPKGAPRIHYVMKLFEDQAELDQELGIYSFLDNEKGSGHLQLINSLPPDGSHAGCLILEKATSTLAREIEEGALTLDAKMAMGSQLIKLIDHLHSHGIMHGDLKPANIMVISKSIAVFDLKLADFDCARHCHQGEFPAMACSSKGLCLSPQYAAPEVILGNKGMRASLSVDMFSLGLILAELFSRAVRPKDAGLDYVRKEAEAGEKALWKQYERSLMVGSGAHSWLADMLRHLLAWKPEDRWTANQLLITWRKGERTSAHERLQQQSNEIANQTVIAAKLDEVNNNVTKVGQSINENLCRLSQQMQMEFNTIKQHQEATMQLILGIKRDDMPRLLLILPEDLSQKTSKKGLMASCKAWTRKHLADSGIQAYYRLIVFDEGPNLLYEVPQLVPVGEGIIITVPGETLKKFAPLIAFAARLAAVMCIASRAAGVPLLGASDCLYEVARFYDEICETNMRSTDSERVMKAFVKGAETVTRTADAIAAVQSPPTIDGATLSEVEKAVADSYDQIKLLLQSQGSDVQRQWNDLTKNQLKCLWDVQSACFRWVSPDYHDRCLSPHYGGRFLSQASAPRQPFPIFTMPAPSIPPSPAPSPPTPTPTPSTTTTNIKKDNQPVSSSAPTSTTVKASRFTAGDKVEARYKGGLAWFPGVTAKVHPTGTYDIDYDDGDKEQGVREDCIRLASSKSSATVPTTTTTTTTKKDDKPNASAATTTTTATTPTTVKMGRFSVGDQIQAQHQLGEFHCYWSWCCGKVSKINADGTYDIEYHNGKTKKGLADPRVRPIQPLSKEEIVEALRHHHYGRSLVDDDGKKRWPNGFKDPAILKACNLKNSKVETEEEEVFLAFLRTFSNDASALKAVYQVLTDDISMTHFEVISGWPKATRKRPTLALENMVRGGLCDLIATALKDFPSEVGLQCQVAYLISAFLDNHFYKEEGAELVLLYKKRQKMFWERFRSKALDVCEDMAATVERHSSDTEIVHSHCQAIAFLLAHDKATRSRFTSPRACKAVIAGLKSFPSYEWGRESETKAYMPALMALAQVASATSSNRALLGSMGACEMVLHGFSRSIEGAPEAVMAAAALGRGNFENQVKLIKAGLWNNLLLDTIQDRQDRTDCPFKEELDEILCWPINCVWCGPYPFTCCFCCGLALPGWIVSRRAGDDDS